MSINKLSTDYVDEVTSQYQYKLTNVDTNIVLAENVTEFTTEGSKFGASDINKTNETINEVIDAIASNTSSITKIVNGTSTSNNIVATQCDSATEVDKLESAVTINGVAFDGTENITIEVDAVSPSDNFILLDKGTLTFTDNECKITNANISANSLAEVVIEPESMSTAFKSVLTVETYDGYVLITAGRTPASTITASIVIRS